MSWYYAGPEAKPIGPITLEELHARKSSGVISPETYVIEHTGLPGDAPVWKRYRELFAAPPPLPTPFLPPPPPPIPPPFTPAQPHPLFPSAAPTTPHHPVFTSPAGPDPYYAVRKTNPWCQWGFALGLVSLPLLIICGLGAFVAPPAFIASIIGLIQKKDRESGRVRAIAGILLSGLTLLITLAFLAWAIPVAIKQHEQTATEQTTNDSD